MVPISPVHALALLCFYVSTFRSLCAVPNVAVFCSSLISWFPGMLLTFIIIIIIIIIIIRIIQRDTIINAHIYSRKLLFIFLVRFS
jgi:hypothetical protein